MKKIIIGIIIGILLCATGVYSTIRDKAIEIIKQENIDKAANR